MKNRKSQVKDLTSRSDENVKDTSTKMTNVAKFFNVLIQLILLSIAGLIIFRTVKHAGIILYTFHPVFMSIGYLILMSHGVLAMADKSIFTQGFTHQQRVTAHWVTQAIALILITIAQSAIYINKDRNNWPHYQSTHSLFGLVTYLLTVTATLGGVLTKYSHQLRSFVKPAMLKIGHGFAGIFVYVLAIATIFLGLNQSWTDYGDLYVKFGVLFGLIISSIYVTSKSFKVAISRINGLSKK